MSIFSNVSLKKVKRSVFDLSYNKKYTCKFGQLIPTMCDEVVPGDVVSLGNTTICRLTPMNAPVLDELIIKSESFFVPYRLLWPDWEKFITGVDSSLKWDRSNPPEFEAPLPCKVIRPRASYSNGHILKDEFKSCVVGSLQDYFGLPVNLYDSRVLFTPGDELSVNAWPWLAYYKIWNDYYRDENLEDEIDIFSLFKNFRSTKDCVVVNSINDGKPFVRSWKKDYFTSALPFQQKGVAPALPIFGSGFADFKDAITPYIDRDNYGVFSSATADSGDWIVDAYVGEGYNHVFPQQFGINANSQFIPTTAILGQSISNNKVVPEYANLSENEYNEVRQYWIQSMNRNIIDTSNFSSVDVAQLRLLLQIQRWLELNARSGTRYTEFLRAHFGVAPRDERLDRAEFIGSTTQSIVVSEVLQTAQTTKSSDPTIDNSLGAMAGHGLSVAGNKVGKYRVKEYGLVMTLTSIFPKPSYQQGINRQWLHTNKYDFLFPEFTGLSEQNIYDKELYVDSTTPSDLDNESEWGYQGRYDELRYKPNLITGHFRSNYDSSEQSLIESGPNLPYSLDYWHLGRFFGSKPELNKDFINIDENGDLLNRIFVVPSEDYCLVDFQNYIKAYRPLPYMAVPGGLS